MLDKWFKIKFLENKYIYIYDLFEIYEEHINKKFKKERKVRNFTYVIYAQMSL